MGCPAPRKSRSWKCAGVEKKEVCTTTEQWGHANSSVHDMYIELFYEGTVYKRMGPDYEVTTVWISSSNDFAKLNAAHLFSELRGKYKVREKRARILLSLSPPPPSPTFFCASALRSNRSLLEPLPFYVLL